MKKINYSRTPDVRSIINDINCFPRATKKKKRIENSIEEIETISKTLEQNFENEIFNSPPMPSTIVEATKDDMISLYNDKFRNSKYYQALLSASDICPICGIRKSDTIDHYFPKSVYFLYSVTPCNLVPSCFQCNKAKLKNNPISSGLHLFHPYFDAMDELKYISMDFYFDSNNNFVPVFKANIYSDFNNNIYRFSFDAYELKTSYELEAVKLFNEHLPIWLHLLRQCGESVLKSLIASETSYHFKDSVCVPFQKAIFENFDLVVEHLKQIINNNESLAA